MQYEKEFTQFVKQLPPAELGRLKETMNTLLQRQKVEEAEKYKSLRLSPSEAADIVEKGGYSTILLVNFGLDCLRYFRTHVMDLEPSARKLWTIAFLVEAGRIIGIRQERARRKERKHERAY